MQAIWGIRGLCIVWAAAVAAAAACSGGGESGSKPGEKGAGSAPAPLRVVLGDCASPTTAFLSGPRPVRGGAWGTEPADVAASPDPFVPGPGNGYGVGGDLTGNGRRSFAPSQVNLGQPNTQGDLDKAIIRRYIRRNTNKLQYCYEKELLAKPNLSGTVVVSFLIGPDGEVKRSSANGVDPEVASCVRGVIASIEFPKPKGGGNVQVNYPLIFRQAGADPAPPPPRGRGFGPGDSTGDIPDDEAGGTGTAMALDDAKKKAAAGGGGSAGSAAAPAPSGPYLPGAANPLRGQEVALAACLRKQSKPYGVFVFDLAPEATGTKLLVHGLGGEAGMCVVELAGKLPKQATPVQRCAVAFGQMPVADAPSVELTAEELQWLGKRVTGTSAITADPEAVHKIDALHERAEAYLKESREVSTVALRGPLVLRAPDDASMKLVGRVIGTLARAGMDYVPARRRASGEWSLLSRVELPVVPVPADAAGMWTISDVGVGEPPPILSILVTAERTWVGLSRINEYQEIVATSGRQDLAKLEQLLAEHKRSARFADRVEIEVSGEDDATYGDVAAALEVAAKVGFTRGRLLEASLISARPQL